MVGSTALVFVAIVLLGSCAWLYGRLRKLRTGSSYNFCHAKWRRQIITRDLLVDIPWHFIVLLLLHEDDRFLVHRGINIPEMFRSVRSLFKRRIKGGSSITQQTVKRLLFKNLHFAVRKPLELIGAIIFESLFSKREIILTYLQIACMGPKIFGLHAAAARLFKKKPAQLTLAESSILISMLPRAHSFCRDVVNGTDPAAVFNFPLAYEKTIHALRVVAATDRERWSLSSREISRAIKRGANPDANPAVEQKHIIAAAKVVHQVPEILTRLRPQLKSMFETSDTSLTSIDDSCSPVVRAIVFLIEDSSSIDFARLVIDLGAIDRKRGAALIEKHGLGCELSLERAKRLGAKFILHFLEDLRQTDAYKQAAAEAEARSPWQEIERLITITPAERWTKFSNVAALGRAVMTLTPTDFSSIYRKCEAQGWRDELLEGLALARQIFDLPLDPQLLSMVQAFTIDSSRVPYAFVRLTSDLI